MRFSADGRFLAYASLAAQSLIDTNGVNDVYLFDLQTQTKTLVSQSLLFAGAANGASDSPDISADGRFVAYRSAALDIVPGRTNAGIDVVLYDRITGVNTLLSASLSGNPGGSNRSLPPVFSGDGRTLVFPSWASDLAGGDYNHYEDVLAYAVLYATVIHSHATGQGPTITWPALPGNTYHVQFKNSLSDINWQPVTGTVKIVGNQGSITDLRPSGAQRVYRVVAN
jgi:Tol biopolymer transport system component